MKRQTLFLNMYGAMLDAMGPSGWWPAKTPLEMAVGAILTQIGRALSLDPKAAMAHRIDNLSVTRIDLAAGGWQVGPINHLP